MKFVDEAQIEVKAGDGGRGCVAFLRERFKPRGGPAGGDGGDGGDIILRADKERTTLLDFKFKPRIVGNPGEHGRGKCQTGRCGAPVVVSVPAGTVVRDARTGEIVADLASHGAEVVVARGGRGGRGNARFATPTNQAPRRAEEGRPGEERTLLLELRLLADVGVIGLPNVGKSTFLAAVSAARPRIADYPFTTIVPTLGVARVGERDLVFADIPGLIEGAHRGAGLGTRFLRHISRTALLVHLLDLSRPNSDPLRDYAIVNDELGAFDATLLGRPQLLVVNKLDLPSTAERLAKTREEFAALGVRVMAMSALTRQGVPEVLASVLEMVETARSDQTEKEVQVPR